VLSEEQAAFGNGRSTTDNLHCVTQLTENRLEVLQYINLVFVDLKEAYDNIQINILWEALENTGISMQIIQVLNTYTLDQFQR
jgi:multidrug efflux pump subunit AcrB